MWLSSESERPRWSCARYTRKLSGITPNPAAAAPADTFPTGGLRFFVSAWATTATLVGVAAGVASILSTLLRLELRFARPGFLGDLSLSTGDGVAAAMPLGPGDSSFTGVSGLRWFAWALRVKSTAVLEEEKGVVFLLLLIVNNQLEYKSNRLPSIHSRWRRTIVRGAFQRTARRRLVLLLRHRHRQSGH